MPLPILQTRPSPSDLLRLFDQTDFRMAQQLAEEELLPCGTAFANPLWPDLPNANHLRQASLPPGMTPHRAVVEVNRYFADRATRCWYWMLNRSTPADEMAPLVEYLLATGFTPDSTNIMYLRQTPHQEGAEAAGVSIIPARASYRHTRQLAEEVAREYKMPDISRAAEAHLLRLEDPHWDALLAMQAGQPVGRAYVLSAGEVGRIEFVYVVPQYRGRGIGRMLMRRALEVCARSQFRHIFLTVESGNDSARSLYSQMGFERVGEMVKYKAPPLAA